MQTAKLTPTKLIQVKMQENTIREIDEIRQEIHAPSLSDTIRRCVGIVRALTRHVDKGDKIIIEGANGDKKQIIITGME